MVDHDGGVARQAGCETYVFDIAKSRMCRAHALSRASGEIGSHADGFIVRGRRAARAYACCLGDDAPSLNGRRCD